jgi:hypothetical protein
MEGSAKVNLPFVRVKIGRSGLSGIRILLFPAAPGCFKVVL